MKVLLFIAVFLILVSLEIAHVYFIMPFPGSQVNNTINLAYFIDRNITWLRLILIVILIYPAYFLINHSKNFPKIVLIMLILLYGVVFYFFNFRFRADKMFYQPESKIFADRLHNKIPGNKLVIGLSINGFAKAFPIQLIGYHHLIIDTIGNVPVLVTYCTVCRSGRAYSPVINDRLQSFRLVGMDHFNAMMEDKDTRSWWQQATGEAVAGPLKGQNLSEIPSIQSTLESWLNQYPNSLILQPDPKFSNAYTDLKDYDLGTVKNNLEKRDTASWNKKAWIVGIRYDQHEKAYDWNDLVKLRLIQDTLASLPVAVFLEKDTTSFHAWSRIVNGSTLQFIKENGSDDFMDSEGSRWDHHGLCISGPLKGQHLLAIPCYQEFWHSWRNFHPHTSVYSLQY